LDPSSAQAHPRDVIAPKAVLSQRLIRAVRGYPLGLRAVPKDFLQRETDIVRELDELLKRERLLSHKDLPDAPARVDPRPVAKLASEPVDAPRLLNTVLDEFYPESRDQPDPFVRVMGLQSPAIVDRIVAHLKASIVKPPYISLAWNCLVEMVVTISRFKHSSPARERKKHYRIRE